MIKRSDDELVMLSALQHFAFCERQCALIHIEQQWKENRLTILGEILHERVHSGKREWQDGRLLVRSLRLVSYTLGVSGQADLVEFLKATTEDGVFFEGLKGKWVPFPVEYKKGKPKSDNIDEVQLCAQAICLEEQLLTRIPEGALFYGAQKKRHPVLFSSHLRNRTIELSKKLHELIQLGITPPATYSAKCKSCSLSDLCQPKWAGKVKKSKYETILFEEPL